MKKILTWLFYSTESFFPSLSKSRGLAGLSFLACLLLLNQCGGGATGGGIGLDAPVADLEGGTFREAAICGNLVGAPAGSFARVNNISDPSIAVVEGPLAADGSYSVKVCMTVGQSVDVQIFNSAGQAISALTSVNRKVDDRTDVCPDPSNPPPTCP